VIGRGRGYIEASFFRRERGGASNLEFSKIYNPLMKWVLRSPLHGMVSKNFMLIKFTGRKSGKVYSTPVNYVRDGDGITVFSKRHRIWWRNLRGGAPVTVWVKGRDLKGIGESIEGEEAIAAGLLAYLQEFPQYAKFYQVTLGAGGQPNPEQVSRFAQENVMIRVQLAQEPIGS